MVASYTRDHDTCIEFHFKINVPKEEIVTPRSFISQLDLYVSVRVVDMKSRSNNDGFMIRTSRYHYAMFNQGFLNKTLKTALKSA